jgi:predicted metal-dependent hydrolase
MSAPADQLALFGGEEAVVVRRSARARRLSLRVFPHGVVEVVAPLRVGERSIRQFVQSHSDWIAKARSGFRALHGDAGLAPPAESGLRRSTNAGKSTTWTATDACGQLQRPAAGG